MMRYIGEIDIHDLRELPSNYKFKDINDKAEFYVIRTFYPKTEDSRTWTFESKWFATEEDAARYFEKDWSFDKGTKPKADIVKVTLEISKQVRTTK